MTKEELVRQVEVGEEAMSALNGITGRVIEECKSDIASQIMHTPATEPETLALLKQSYDTLCTFKNRLSGYAQAGIAANSELNGSAPERVGRVL